MASSKRSLSEDTTFTTTPLGTKRQKRAIFHTTAPSRPLDIYVFGSGENGELGLGASARHGREPTRVKRPRLNDLLSAKSVGVVQIAVGALHCVALTRDNRILTWGVNDNGALGRETGWDEVMRDADALEEAESDVDEDVLNPKESTPTALDPSLFGESPRTFVQVAASHSASFALTEDGAVYGWGTFRGNDGLLGFSVAEAIDGARQDDDHKKFQRTPALIPELKKIKYIAAGGNHVQALDHKGSVFIWGSGEQCQLGRRIVERSKAQALTPRQFGLPKNKIKYISCGSYHGFAIDMSGQVWAWGHNNYGQTGVVGERGEVEQFVERPTVVKSLQPFRIKEIQGGNHHSIACTEDGDVLVWGRCDDGQAGISLETLPKASIVFDDREQARILKTPTVVPGIDAIHVAAGIDNSFAISSDGRVYSWGFSADYRTGFGTDDAIHKATVIANTAVRGKKLTFAGCGAHFSVLAGPAMAAE